MEKNQTILTKQRSNTLIAIGDIHGLNLWRNIVQCHPDARYVFLGDYCDPYGKDITNEQVLENIHDIIDFKQRYPDRVVLLLGNHDIHYLWNGADKGSRYNLALAPELTELFHSHESLFQPASGCNRLLFTHAGVLHSWIDRLIPDSHESVANYLNAHRNDKALLHCSFLRGGLDDYSGIYWADREEFTYAELLPGYIQVVGHNKVPSIRVMGKSITSTGYTLFCDCLRNGNYLIIEDPETDVPKFYEANLDAKHTTDNYIHSISAIVEKRQE